jgi:AraC-like DNA-binding protein
MIQFFSVNLELYFEKTAHKGDYIAKHNHKFLELVYYSGGIGRSAINNHRYQIHRGTFTITPSGVYHDQENLTDLSSFCILLSDSHMESHTGGWLDYSGNVGRKVLQLFIELAEKKTGFELISDGILLEIAGIVERLTEEYKEHSHLSKEDLVNTGIDLIGEKEGLISVAELAEHLNVSKDYLRHLFLDHVGKSPHKMIVSTKIKKAAALLKDPHFSITEIAEQCGYVDVYYFSSQFKKNLSMSPTQFRKQWLDGANRLGSGYTAPAE